MRAVLLGQVVRILRDQPFAGKDGRRWEKATIQFQSDYAPDQPIEIENIDLMDEEGKLQIDPLFLVSLKNNKPVKLLVNLTMDIDRGKTFLRTRVIKAYPMDPGHDALEPVGKVEAAAGGKA